MKHMRMFCLLAILTFACRRVRARRDNAVQPRLLHLRRRRKLHRAAPATFASVVDRQVSQYEKNMVEAAEAMPADKFDFTPASLNIPGAAYNDVRTFAALVKHTATANYRFWTTLTGEKMPENIKGPNGPDELKTKDADHSIPEGLICSRPSRRQNPDRAKMRWSRCRSSAARSLACSWLQARSFMPPTNTARWLSICA